jgi:pimeloyl-ACP methyl ester carboxylesterase
MACSARLMLTLSAVVLACVAVSGDEATVSVSGHKMRVRTAHLSDRKPGQPVVILEGGSLQSVETWNAVFTRIAELGPVVAYDRRGVGQSEFDGEPQTLTHVAGSLHSLLVEMKVTPPLVLVGHSYGGLIVSAYARDYAREVAGLVYLDAPDTDMTAADLAAVSPDASRIQTSELESFPQNLPAGMRAELENLRTLVTGDPGQMRALHPPSGIPMAVVVAAGKVDRVQDAAERAIRAGILQLQMKHEQQWALAVPEGLFVVTRRGGHFVHQDDPDVTVSAIRHVLASLR